jgi:hypothetical protein
MATRCAPRSPPSRKPSRNLARIEESEPARLHQLGWNYEQAVTPVLQTGLLQMRGNSEPFGPVQQVVGQEDEPKENFVGCRVLGGKPPGKRRRLVGSGYSSQPAK